MREASPKDESSVFPIFLVLYFICYDNGNTFVPPDPLIQYPQYQLSAVYRDLKKLKNQRIVLFVRFIRLAKRERAVTCWNPAAQTRPVLDSSSFDPILKLLYRTSLHFASSVLAVHISCHVIAVFVFRKPLFIN
jgi:hypothetical protein